MLKPENLGAESAPARHRLVPLIGHTLTGYETAEVFYEKESLWERWDSLPLRLYFAPSSVVSLSWSSAHNLQVTPDEALPYWYHGNPPIRWSGVNVPDLEKCVGHSLLDVRLGRGEAIIAGKQVETWTSLMLGFEEGWFEIFSALDENGYDYHPELPAREFRSCV